MPELPKIPVMSPRLPRAEKYFRHLQLMDENRYYSNRGPLVQEYEKSLSEKLGLDSGLELVVCANATIALEGFLSIVSTPTWRVPAFTFAASVHAARNSGVDFKLVDIETDSWMLGTSNPTEGHMVVLPFGAAFNSEPYKNVETVLIDAAASIGNASTWINTIRANWAAVFSLHATKAFGIGEGGAIIFGNTDLAKAFRAWINFGFNGSRDSISPGTNGKMSELQAAVGLAVLEAWRDEESEWTALRFQADAINHEYGISPNAFVQSPTSPYWIVSAPSSADINSIERVFSNRGIETRRWWSLGCHKMPEFRRYFPQEFPNTDEVGSTYLGIPFFRDMTDSHFSQISIALDEAINRA